MIPVPAVRAVLMPFGAFRPQPASEWTGEGDLPPALARFYLEIGPDADPDGSDGVTIPSFGNPYWLAPLRSLWEFQAGYRWDALSKRPIVDWRDDWLVVADQGGDPFIFEETNGTVLHDQHGRGGWQPQPIFADIFVMAWAPGTIGAVLEEAGDDLHDEDFELRPTWRDRVRARLAVELGLADADRVATRLDW